MVKFTDFLKPPAYFPSLTSKYVLQHPLLQHPQSLILVNDQLDALFPMCLFHASTCFEQQVLIMRRIKLCQYIIWYNTLQWVTVTHWSVLYQMMYWHKLVLLMMSTCCSKHVEAWNKHNEKECVKFAINQNYVEMHGQQNIKNKISIFFRYHSILGITAKKGMWTTVPGPQPKNLDCSVLGWDIL